MNELGPHHDGPVEDIRVVLGWRSWWSGKFAHQSSDHFKGQALILNSCLRTMTITDILVCRTLQCVHHMAGEGLWGMAGDSSLESQMEGLGLGEKCECMLTPPGTRGFPV